MNKKQSAHIFFNKFNLVVVFKVNNNGINIIIINNTNNNNNVIIT